MSEKENRNRTDADYGAMTTEELEKLLRLDMEGSAGADTEDVLLILEELDNRKKAEEKTGNTAQKAWESFQRDYLPENEEQPVRKRPTPWLRNLAAVAAVLVLLLGVAAAVDAFSGGNLWNIVANWSKDTFRFAVKDTQEADPTPKEGRVFETFQQAIVEQTDETDLVPTQIPEGYTLDEIQIDDLPGQVAYVAIYSNRDKHIWVSVKEFIEMDPQWIEKNTQNAECYEVGGTQYYILENNGQLTAAWTKGSYECYITGEVTVGEIKTMINSIGKE